MKKRKYEYKTYLNIRLEVVRENPVKYLQCSTPDEVFKELKAEYVKYPNEVLKCIHFNTKNYVIGIETIAVGSLSGCCAVMREIFKGAVINNSASIIVTHNHLSGDPSPSREDKIFTDNLFEAGKLLGIKVLDHIIFGIKDFYSFSPV